MLKSLLIGFAGYAQYTDVEEFNNFLEEFV